jgi:hypothetical protein
MSSAHATGRRTPPPAQTPSLPDQPPSLSPGKQTASGRDGRKERRNPSITPRKFNRFFTPRSLRSSDATSSRHALHEINYSTNSRDVTQSSPVRPPRIASGQENSPTTFTRDLKRRKLYHTPDSSPEHTYLEGKGQEVGFKVMQDIELREQHENIPSSPCERIPRDLKRIEEETAQEPLSRIVQMEDRGLGAQLLQLSINAQTCSRRLRLSYPINGRVLYYVTIWPS